MKAFQLKITIKNSKPSIWRRVIVPSGITFLQLRQLQQIDFSVMFTDIVPKATSLSDIVGTAYSLVQDELEEEGDENDSFTEAEVQEALTEQATNSKGFQAGFAG